MYLCVSVRQITRSEQRLFLVLVLLCPAVVMALLTEDPRGDLFVWGEAAVVGAAIWWVCIVFRSPRQQPSDGRGFPVEPVVKNDETPPP